MLQKNQSRQEGASLPKPRRLSHRGTSACAHNTQTASPGPASLPSPQDSHPLPDSSAVLSFCAAQTEPHRTLGPLKQKNFCSEGRESRAMRPAGLLLLAALMDTVVQPPLLWTGGGQQPLTTLHGPRLGLQSHGLLPWMSSPSLSCVRHTALDLGPTLNPGCAHLKIFSLIPSEKSLLQMRSCSQAPGTVFWRGHHSTCDIHQDWGHQVPESDVGR